MLDFYVISIAENTRESPPQIRRKLVTAEMCFYRKILIISRTELVSIDKVLRTMVAKRIDRIRRREMNFLGHRIMK